jgi:hypothetical protein
MSNLAMTAAGHSALEGELKQRIRVERPHLLQRIHDAIAADPNLAENSEYQAAIAEQEFGIGGGPFYGTGYYGGGGLGLVIVILLILLLLGKL